MPTEPAHLFLFAHQDDEYGVFQALDACRLRAAPVRCAYLTDGATARVSAATRNAESLAVLAQLGVAPASVAFAGQELGIGDAALPLHLAAAAAWLERWIVSAGPVAAIHVPAWEGGHHDHDALHALTVQIAARLGMLDKVRQFPLYNGARVPHPLFRMQSPLPENGPVQASRLPFALRLRCLRWCLSYPSQRGTWIGLFPFALWSFLVGGVQSLQGASLARIGERPHAGALYYEKRHFFSWPDMQRRLAAWRDGPESPS